MNQDELTRLLNTNIKIDEQNKSLICYDLFKKTSKTFKLKTLKTIEQENNYERLNIEFENNKITITITLLNNPQDNIYLCIDNKYINYDNLKPLYDYLNSNSK